MKKTLNSIQKTDVVMRLKDLLDVLQWKIDESFHTDVAQVGMLYAAVSVAFEVPSDGHIAYVAVVVLAPMPIEPSFEHVDLIDRLKMFVMGTKMSKEEGWIVTKRLMQTTKRMKKRLPMKSSDVELVVMAVPFQNETRVAAFVVEVHGVINPAVVVIVAEYGDVVVVPVANAIGVVVQDKEVPSDAYEVVPLQADKCL
jgi:hypothetical protein